MDCGLPAFTVQGILQARTLEWVAISLSSLLKATTVIVSVFLFLYYWISYVLKESGEGEREEEKKGWRQIDIYTVFYFIMYICWEIFMLMICKEVSMEHSSE